MNRNIISVFFLSILLLSLFMSCPDPITEDLVARVEDKGAPTIIVSTPSNNSIYRSLVTFSGRVTDDAKNSIERFSFNVQNRPIGGGVIISGSSVSQDTSAGETVVSYTPSNGNFSFSFSTIDPDVLTGRLFIDLEAVDWNGNTYEETIILYENEDGPYVDLVSPTIDTTYETSISISGSVMDYYSTEIPVDIENIDYIKWTIQTSPVQTKTIQIYPVDTTDSDNDGIISNGSFQFTTSTGAFSDTILMTNQVGTKSFSFIAVDLNGHAESYDFNISDGNYSPAIEIDSISPPVCGYDTDNDGSPDNARYLRSGDDVVFNVHVGPTVKAAESFTYTVTPAAGTGVTESITFYDYYTDPDDGTTTYYYTNSGDPVETGAYSSATQTMILEFTAVGASDSSTQNVLFKADNTSPSVDSLSVDSSNGYITLNLSEPVWGGKYFSSIVTKDDFKAYRVSNSNEITISSITDTSGSALSEVSGYKDIRIYFDLNDPDLLQDGTTGYRIASRSTSENYTVYDRANNILGSKDFTFRDHSLPYIETKSPTGTATVSELPYSADIALEFNEAVTLVNAANHYLQITTPGGSTSNVSISLSDG